MDPAGWNTLLSDIVEALTQSISKDGQTKLTGPLDFGGYKARNIGAPTRSSDALRLSMLERGADIASASTIDIPMEGQLFTVTGTEDISRITSHFDGKIAFLQFDDSLSLINSADLVLPEGKNYLTEPGETALYLSLSAASGQLFSMKPMNSGAEVWAAVLAI